MINFHLFANDLVPLVFSVQVFNVCFDLQPRAIEH